MRYLLLILGLCLGCSNPMGVDDPVEVYLYLTTSGYNIKISSCGQMISLLDWNGDRDTVTVADGSILKAKLRRNGITRYQTFEAEDKATWKLP